MEKVMDFLKENFYYVLGAFVLFIIFIVLIVSCSSFSNVTSYEKLENKLVSAAKEYYNENEKKLPRKEDETVSVSLSFLVQNKYIKQLKDPKDSKRLCTGEVEVTKRGKNYNYQGFLECGTNYKTQFLADALKSSLKLDDNGNGLYKINEEYIFKGDNVKNYVRFNNELWQVIKIDKDGDIKLLKLEATDEDYPWDDRYNVITKEDNGINDFKRSRIRETLESYYRNNFNKVSGVKEKIVKKEFCIGIRKKTDDIVGTAECSSTIKMYVGLITASEFYMASLDSNCKKFLQEQCSNYNYMTRKFKTWTLTGLSEKRDRVYIFSNDIDDSYASDDRRIFPVINIDSKTISRGGTGSLSNPFIVK